MTGSFRQLRRLLILALLALVASVLAGAPVPLGASGVGQPEHNAATQTGPNQAGVVVRYADGDVETACITFDQVEITGDEALRLAGIDLGLATDGRVCSVNGIGCGPNDCWCQCTDLANCTYWAYYHLDGNAWNYSENGATNFMLGNGAVEGWSWGTGALGVGGVEPPVFTFDQICSDTTQDNEVPTAVSNPAPGLPAEQGTAPPQISFFTADPDTIVPGGCTILQWSALNATQVQLDGLLVAQQGQQQVCPPASQTYSLVAESAAGGDARDMTVQVQPAAAPAAVQSGALLGQAPESGAPPAVAEESAAPVATLLVVTAEPFRFALPPTSTPRPRSVLGAGGRPTPTPLLVARADDQPRSQVPEQALRRQRGDAGLPATGRAFRASLMPGYAAFLFMAATLLAMTAWVARRKSRASSGSSDGRGRREQ